MNTVVYCPLVDCRSYIPPRRIQGHIGTCEQCNTRVCVFCRLHEHPPNANCCGPVVVNPAIVNPAIVGLQACLDVSIAWLREDEIKMRNLICKLMIRNSNAVARIPGAFPKFLVDKYKSDLKARHFVFEDMLRALPGNHAQMRHEQRQRHAASLAAIGGPQM